jgi:hypothetical protein
MSATAEQVKVHQFYSRGRLERLVRRPLDFAELASGRRIKTQERVLYDFGPNGRLEIRDGQDMLADGPVDPATGEPTMQDALAWLMAHPLLNERFWCEGREPGRPLPTENDFLELLTGHVIALEAAPIEVLLASERASHDRRMLIDAAERALSQVLATREELARQAEGEPPAAA